MVQAGNPVMLQMPNPFSNWTPKAAGGFLRAGIALACATGISAGLAGQIASFPSGGTGWQLGTIAVGNLDGSPDLEIVVPYRDSTGSWFLDAFKYTGERLPGFPYAAGGDPINVSPTLADLDGDGRAEILLTRGNQVVALRADGSVMWSHCVDSSSYVPNGGYQTVTNGFYWWPTGDWLDHLPGNTVFSSEVSPPIVADLNGTGNFEVITAWKIQPTGGQDYNPFIYPVYGVGQWGTMGESWSGGVVTLAAGTGMQNSVYHFHHLVESGLAVGKPNLAGPQNIYALNDSDSVVSFDKSSPFGLWGKGMLHKQFGKNQRLMTGSYQVPIDIYTADIDGDGLDEVLVAGTQMGSLWQPNETILDDDGGILWRRWLPHVDLTNNSGWLNSASLIPINPDHDNHIDVLGWNHSYELTFRFWNGSELVDHPGWPKDFYPLLPTPPVVGDVDGDGAEEIIVGTYDPTGSTANGELRVYGLDGVLKQSVTVPGGVKQIPALADVEGVGRLDIVCRSMLGQIYIWNFGSRSTNLVSWATHRANMQRDGNSRLSLYPPGTPMVNLRASGFNRTRFGWTNAAPPQCYRIYRAAQASGPFVQIATLTPQTTSYTDYGLQPGTLYFYEVGASFSTNTARSAPFAILSLLNDNLIANSGFEADSNCRWDKWFTGAIGMTNMNVSTNIAFQGKRSMQILLENQADNGTVAQYNQYGIPDSSITVTQAHFYSFGGYFKSTGISLPSEHWLEWSSTKTGSDTNDRPALPDPFYFTPHFFASPAPADWTYVNRTFQLPTGFPNIELRHRYSITGDGSGSIYLDNVFFRQIPEPAATSWTTLVPFGAHWRYSTSPPPANWFAADFPDTAWLTGTAKFGAGSGPTNIVTRLPERLPNYYFRKQFTLTSTNVEEFLLEATCTDVSLAMIYPLQLFLNGISVPAIVDVVTLQGNETRYFDLTPYAGLLKQGTNTVAVAIGNSWSDYDDVAFDLALKVVPYHPILPQLTLRYGGTGNPSISVETAPGTIWQLQSSDQMSFEDWQVVQTFTNTGNQVQTFLDTGQDGRTPPGNVSNRYYRLKPF
jgi:hypothetical protein